MPLRLFPSPVLLLIAIAAIISLAALTSNTGGGLWLKTHGMGGGTGYHHEQKVATTCMRWTDTK